MDEYDIERMRQFHNQLVRIADALEDQNEIQAKKVRVFDSFSLIKFLLGRKIK